MTLSGPNSRKLLSELTDIDMDKEAFPFMTWKEATSAACRPCVPYLVHR